MKFCFDRGDLVLLHEEKIAIHFVRHVVLLVIADAAEIVEHPWQRIRARANNVTNQLISARIGVGQLQHRIGEFVNVVISLDIDVRLGVGGAAEIIQPDAVPERPANQNAREKFYHLRTSQRHQQQRSPENQRIRPHMIVRRRPFVCLRIINCVGEQTEKQERAPSVGNGSKSQRRGWNKRAKNKQERPDETDDAPRRFVFDDAVSDQRPDAINGEIAQTHRLEPQCENAQKQTG